tara:strand:+ start:25917 stop:26033 length:117 start_codon:yes stop_codon:yes gene_type:complete
MGSFDDLDLKVAEKFGERGRASAAEHVKRLEVLVTSDL